MAKITDLPPEILRMIFYELRYDSIRSPYNSIQSSYNTLKVSPNSHIARTMCKQLSKIQLVNKTWERVLQDTMFPMVHVGAWSAYTYGVHNSSYWCSALYYDHTHGFKYSYDLPTAFRRYRSRTDLEDI